VLSKLPAGDDITARAQPGPPAGSGHVDCAAAILINKITSATGVARGSYGMTIAQLEVREQLDP